MVACLGLRQKTRTELMTQGAFNVGQPLKRLHKSSKAGPTNRSEGSLTDGSKPCALPPAKVGVRYEPVLLFVAGIVALALVGLALRQTGSHSDILEDDEPVQVAANAAVARASARPSADTPAPHSLARANETGEIVRTTVPNRPAEKIDAAAARPAAPVLPADNDKTETPVAPTAVPNSIPDARLPDRAVGDPTARPVAEGASPATPVGPALQPENGPSPDTPAIDEPDDYENAGADDFACPVPWLKDSKMIERVKYLNALQSLLKSGWEDKPGSVAAARGHFETAKKICGDDPRLGYAFGLVLWKNGLHSEARKSWEAATKTGRQPFLPALSVVAWATLLDHDTAGGFAALQRIAEALAQPQGAYPTAAQRTHAALFMGRAIGFLKGPGKTPELIDQVLATEKQLLDELPETLRMTFEQGGAQAARRFEQFQRRVERPAAEIVAELEQEKQRIAVELSALRQVVKQGDERQREIPREAKKKVAELADETADLEARIYQASAGVQQAQVLANELAQPRRIFAGYATVTDEVLVKGNDKDGKGGKERHERGTRQVPQYRNENAQEVSARLKNRDQELARANSLAAELRQFNKRYNEIPIERNDFLKSLRLEKLEKGRAITAARRSIAEHVAHERDVARDFATPDELRKRMTSLAPYVPWTADSDRDGLVASYRQPASQPTSKKTR